MRPWKQLQSTPVVEDRWFRVTADRCELPNGMVLDPFYVVHEKEWAQIFAVDAKNHLLVVRQYRYAANATCLELPGGVIEPGEEPLAAAKRELLEETGYSSTEWELVGSMFANPARQTNRVHIFFARNIVATAQRQLDASEDIEYSLLPLPAVQKSIESGEFSQALHIASYYRCIHHADGSSGGA
jgi:8-oxo-dGTP pyrophosphatase MutT (NUDIX family)